MNGCHFVSSLKPPLMKHPYFTAPLPDNVIL